MLFCCVCRQFLGFLPADVRVLQVVFHDVRPVCHWPSWLPLVSLQHPSYVWFTLKENKTNTNSENYWDWNVMSGG